MDNRPSAPSLARNRTLPSISSSRVVFLIFAASILSSSACALLYISSPDLQSIVNRVTACKGTPAPWQNQLSLADQQAKSMDSSAVLSGIYLSVFTSPDADEDANSCLDIDFTYAKPDGGNIQVSIRDMDPPELLRTNRNASFQSFPVRTQDDLFIYRNVRSMIKLSPRDVLSRTYADGLAFSNNQRASVHPMTIGISFDDASVEPQGRPNWYIVYYTPSRELLMRVSPEDGSIIERKER